MRQLLGKGVVSGSGVEFGDHDIHAKRHFLVLSFCSTPTRKWSISYFDGDVATLPT